VVGYPLLSPAEDKTDDSIPLSVHSTNWQSADSDLPTMRNLVAQELEKNHLLRENEKEIVDVKKSRMYPPEQKWMQRRMKLPKRVQ
jgi:hypothetical protein